MIEEMNYSVAYDDVRIQVTAVGRGPRLVLLPSLGRDVDDFFPVARSLARRGYRVLMPSPRGINLSEGPLRNISLREMARDVAEVIRDDSRRNRSEGSGTGAGGKAVVAGHAFGNWVARMSAVCHPELVSAVVLLAAAQRDFPAALRNAIDRIMDGRRHRIERLDALQEAFFAPGHDATAWLSGWHPEAALAQREAGRASPQSSWWAAGAVPVLDVQAEFDLFAPRSGASCLRDELGPRVTIELIRDAGHALLPEQPAAVTEVLLRFLSSIR